MSLFVFSILTLLLAGLSLLLPALSFAGNAGIYLNPLFTVLLAVSGYAVSQALRMLHRRRVMFFCFGILAGKAAAWLSAAMLPGVLEAYKHWLYLFWIPLGVSYLLHLERRANDDGGLVFPGWLHRKQGGKYHILDTSCIIDGRIADVVDAGFMQGILVVPQFILDELQQIADSYDSIKRSRGRRGLDVLNRIRVSENCEIRITDIDFPQIAEVDSKLLALAEQMGASIITNDFNLNKIAELKEIQVLNINDLSNAVKPAVLPGEKITVTVIKEGKDPNQGVAYLDDGTMIVVEHGKRFINQKIGVVVTGVFQTPAGRMIFSETPAHE
jgi:rRNA-processing protein FCF1